MKTKLQMRNSSTGTIRNGSVPKNKATPALAKTSPEYIGLRVKRNGPCVTRILLLTDVGMTSVPAAAKVFRPHTARKIPATVNKIASDNERKYTICAQAKLP